jgi:hypothetical protein
LCPKIRLLSIDHQAGDEDVAYQREGMAMLPQQTAAYWAALEAGADQLHVQAKIREAIRQGRIRVKPALGGGIRITPCNAVTNDATMRLAG